MLSAGRPLLKQTIKSILAGLGEGREIEAAWQGFDGAEAGPIPLWIE